MKRDPIEFSPLVKEKVERPWTAAAPRQDWYRDPAVRSSLAYCQQQTAHFAKSFYFCSHLLPQAEKFASYAIYAFCRHVDDVIDEAQDPLQDGQALLQEELKKITTGGSALPFAPAFAVVVEEYAIPAYLLEELIHGCCLDEIPQAMQDFAELESYCYYVASVVGLMMSKVFGLQEQAGVRHAVGMGVAMQLTNILRDVHEDAERGRRYLPAEELQSFGLPLENLYSVKDSPAWRDFMKFQIERARRYYQFAEEGISYLRSGTPQVTTRAMSRVYGGILGEIERQNYDVFTRRATTSTGKKIGLLVQAILSRS